MTAASVGLPEFVFHSPGLSPADACGVRALIAAALAAGRLGGGAVSVGASPPKRAVVARLAHLVAERRQPSGCEMFPVLTRCALDEEVGKATVELHPRMASAHAVRDLMAHLLASAPHGALLRRLWGRWEECVTEPTEPLMEALGVAHLRFTQFREDVLEAGVAAIAAVVGAEIAVDYEKEGRGGKVVRVIFRVGAAPGWLTAGRAPSAPLPDDPEALDVPPLAAEDRARLYRNLARFLKNNVPLGVACHIIAGRADGTPVALAARRIGACCERTRGLDPHLDRYLAPIEAFVLRTLDRSGALGRGMDDAAGLVRWLARAPSSPERARGAVYRVLESLAQSGASLPGAVPELLEALDAEAARGGLSEDEAEHARAVVRAYLCFVDNDRDWTAMRALLPADELTMIELGFSMFCVENNLADVVRHMDEWMAGQDARREAAAEAELERRVAAIESALEAVADAWSDKAARRLGAAAKEPEDHPDEHGGAFANAAACLRTALTGGGRPRG